MHHKIVDIRVIPYYQVVSNWEESCTDYEEVVVIHHRTAVSFV